jgi:hypothetical protein
MRSKSQALNRVHFAALGGDIDELRSTTALSDRQLSQLRDSHRFTESHVKGAQERETSVRLVATLVFSIATEQPGT